MSLDFLYNIDAKIDGVVKMLESVDHSIKSLHELDKASSKGTASLGHIEQASHRAGAAHRRHGTDVVNLGHQFEHAKTGVHEFAEALGLVMVFEGMEKLVEKTFELGEEMIHAAAKAERTDKSFKSLLGAAEGGELLEYLEDVSRHTEFTNAKLQDTAGSLLRVGFAGEGLKRALAAGLDMAALPGGNLDEALSSIERLKRTGRVDNRTLGGLGFGEKDFLKQLSARTGRPSEALKKDMEKGKLNVNQALETLYDLIHKRTGKALGAVGVEMSQTLGARLTHLADAPEELYKSLSKTEAFEKFSAMVGQLADDLDPKGPIGSRIVSGLQGAFTEVTDFISKIDWRVGVDALLDGLHEAKLMAESLAETVKAATPEWILSRKSHFLTSESIDEAGVRQVHEAQYDPEVQAADAHMRATQRKLKALRASRGFGPMMGPPTLEAIESGKAIAEGHAKGIALGIPEVQAATKTQGRSAVQSFRDELQMRSPSRVFEQLGRLSGQGYLEGLDDSMATMTDSVPVGAFAKPARGGAGGPIQVTVHIETNVTGHGGAEQTAAEIGAQVATQVESILPGALDAAFEKLRLEAGA